MNKSKIACAVMLSTCAVPASAATWNVLGGTFYMTGGAPISIIAGAGTFTDRVFTSDYTCAGQNNVDPVRAMQCENAGDGTPGSPTYTGPDDATASINGLDTFNFFGAPMYTYFAATGVDFPATPHSPPLIDLAAGAADMSSFYASWNGTEFHQGSFDPNNPVSGSTAATVSDNLNGTYTIEWSSLIVGGPFNNITGNWTMTVTPVPVPASIWLFGSGLLLLITSIKSRRNIDS